MNNQKFTSLVAAGLFAATVSGQAHATEADNNAKEKCYGVVKAGKNDCGVQGKHSCAGQATEDASGSDWVFVPKGLCEKLVNGSLKPATAAAASKAKKEEVKTEKKEEKKEEKKSEVKSEKKAETKSEHKEVKAEEKKTEAPKAEEKKSEAPKTEEKKEGQTH